jgi:hypothetical protein
MNDDQCEDLKCFIDARISQPEVQFDRNLQELKADIEQRIDEIQAAVTESISAANDENDEQLSEYEQRLAKLEHRTA